MFSLLHHHRVIICRCCLVEQPPLYHHIHEAASHIARELVELTPSLRLQSDDGLTDVICELCLRQLRDALDFRQRCTESEQILHERHEQWCRTVAAGEALALDDVLECLEREVGSLPPTITTNNNNSIIHNIPSTKPIACVAPIVEPIDFAALGFASDISVEQCDNQINNFNWAQLNTPIHTPSSMEYSEQQQPLQTSPPSPPPTKTTTLIPTPITILSPLIGGRKITSPKSLHPCSECEKKFTRNFQLKLHLISVHGLGDGLRYKCDTCDKTFASRHSLQYHVKSLHSTDRPFPCPNCERRFVLRTQLVSHLRTHTGELKPRNFICTKCSKTWPTKSDLRTHMRSHDPNLPRPFQCDRCPKAFFTRGHLHSHTLVHTGQKPFACEFCERCYQSVGNLNNHMIRQHADIIEGHQQQHHHHNLNHSQIFDIEA